MLEVRVRVSSAELWAALRVGELLTSQQQRRRYTNRERTNHAASKCAVALARPGSGGWPRGHLRGFRATGLVARRSVGGARATQQPPDWRGCFGRGFRASRRWLSPIAARLNPLEPVDRAALSRPVPVCEPCRCRKP